MLEVEIATLTERAYQLLDEERIALAPLGRDAPQSRAGGIGLNLRVYQGVDVLRAEGLEADLTDAAQLQAPRDGKARGHHEQKRGFARERGRRARGRRVEPVQVFDDKGGGPRRFCSPTP
jgi:hypothetical protein